MVRSRRVDIDEDYIEQRHARLITQLNLNAHSPLRSEGVAAVLSFFWCGVGNIYNGRVGKGGMIAICVPILVLGMVVAAPLTIFFAWIPYLYCILDAVKEAERINIAIGSLIKSDKKILDKRAIAKQKKVRDAIYTVEKFKQELSKYGTLYVNDVINDEDLSSRMQGVFNKVETSPLEKDMDDYLLAMVQLDNDGLLQPEYRSKLQDVLASV